MSRPFYPLRAIGVLGNIIEAGADAFGGVTVCFQSTTAITRLLVGRSFSCKPNKIQTRVNIVPDTGKPSAPFFVIAVETGSFVDQRRESCAMDREIFRRGIPINHPLVSPSARVLTCFDVDAPPPPLYPHQLSTALRLRTSTTKEFRIV